MTTLPERIATYILSNPQGVTLDAIVKGAMSKGVSYMDVLDALEYTHKDPRIARTASSSGVVTYRKFTRAVGSSASGMTHLSWLRANYPWPGKNGVPPFEMPFPEIDMSWMFLKSHEERIAYKAAAKNMPTRMVEQQERRIPRGSMLE